MTATGSPEVMSSFPFPFPTSDTNNDGGIHLDLSPSPLRVTPSASAKGRIVRVLPPPHLLGVSPRPPPSLMDSSGSGGLSGSGGPSGPGHPGLNGSGGLSGPGQPGLNGSPQHPALYGSPQYPGLSPSTGYPGLNGSGGPSGPGHPGLNGSPQYPGLSPSTGYPGPSGSPLHPGLSGSSGYPGPFLGSLDSPGLLESPGGSPGMRRHFPSIANPPSGSSSPIRQRASDEKANSNDIKQPDMFCSFCLLGGFKMKLTITGTGPTKAVFCRKCSREDPPIGSKICTNPTCRQLHMPEDDSRRCTVCSGQLYKKKK